MAERCSVTARQLSRCSDYVWCWPLTPRVLAAQEEAGEGLRLNKDLIPDALHPNALGQDRVFTCLEPHLAPYLPMKANPM